MKKLQLCLLICLLIGCSANYPAGIGADSEELFCRTALQSIKSGDVNAFLALRYSPGAIDDAVNYSKWFDAVSHYDFHSVKMVVEDAFIVDALMTGSEVDGRTLVPNLIPKWSVRFYYDEPEASNNPLYMGLPIGFVDGRYYFTQNKIKSE